METSRVRGENLSRNTTKLKKANHKAQKPTQKKKFIGKQDEKVMQQILKDIHRAMENGTRYKETNTHKNNRTSEENNHKSHKRSHVKSPKNFQYHSTRNEKLVNQSVRENHKIVTQALGDQTLVNQTLLNQKIVNQKIVNQKLVNQKLVNQKLVKQYETVERQTLVNQELVKQYESKNKKIGKSLTLETQTSMIKSVTINLEQIYKSIHLKREQEKKKQRRQQQQQQQQQQHQKNKDKIHESLMHAFERFKRKNTLTKENPFIIETAIMISSDDESLPNSPRETRKQQNEKVKGQEITQEMKQHTLIKVREQDHVLKKIPTNETAAVIKTTTTTTTQEIRKTNRKSSKTKESPLVSLTEAILQSNFLRKQRKSSQDRIDMNTTQNQRQTPVRQSKIKSGPKIGSTKPKLSIATNEETGTKKFSDKFSSIVEKVFSPKNVKKQSLSTPNSPTNTNQKKSYVEKKGRSKSSGDWIVKPLNRPWVKYNEASPESDTESEMEFVTETTHSVLDLTDENGRFIVSPGIKIGDYTIVKELGRGSFSVVVSARMSDDDDLVALKIIRAENRFLRAGRAEIAILKHLHEDGLLPGLIHHESSFMAHGHLVIVFPLHSMTLYDALKKTPHAFSLPSVQQMSKQLLTSLKRLASRKVMHCDIKPENIVVSNVSRSTLLTIIDFGSSSTISSGLAQSYIQSRFYRSPEVLLGVKSKISPAIDIWSLGCLIYELVVGRPLFACRSEVELLSSWIETLGMPPSSLIESGSRSNLFFRKDDSGFVLADRIPKSPSSRSLSHRFNVSTSLSPSCIISKHLPNPAWHGHYTFHQWSVFVDFLSSMLDYNPTTRASPSQCLSHPFFSLSF